MKLKVILLSICSGLVLSGCQANGVKDAGGASAGSSSSLPEQSSPSNVSAPTPSSGAAASLNAKGFQPSSAAEQFNYLSGQLTSVQEQVINIQSGTAELQQNLQVVLAQLQILNSSQSVSDGMKTPKQNASALNSSGNDVTSSAVLEQIQVELARLQQSTNTAYQLTSGYTAQGQWVLIRYNQFTGQSWLADQGTWVELNESTGLVDSQYRVELQRADKDIKGYVAARIDQQSGQTWWLKQDTWMSFD